MRSRDVLTYAYEQIEETFARTVEELEPDDLNRQVQPGANPIGWLAWHLLRVQDDHVAEVAGTEQVWTAEGWAGRFGLPVDDAATGYGMGDDEVDAVRVPSADLRSEEHTSELQSRQYLVCRLLLENKMTPPH